MAGCGPVRASRRDGVEGVGHRDDACAQRNVCTGETVGIALPVHALVVMAHQSGEVRILRPSTSPTGNVHGMPLAAALGACGFDFGSRMHEPPWAAPERVVLIDVRSLDPGERELVRDNGLHVFTMSEIDRCGVAAVVHQALDIVAGESWVHLSLDVDVCDPEIAPGVGTPVRGGLSYREAHLAMELIAESRLMTSMEVVELNPVLDLADETGILAVDLVASALGARIL
jgi:arginase